MRTTMTPSTPSTMTRTITTRTNCTSEHSSAPLVVFHVSLTMCHTTLAQVVHVSVISSSRHVYVRFSLIFTYTPFYFNLSFTVFFHSSVLMHPDLHTDLDNLDSVENNLRHSAKGSLDAYDVTFSLTLTELDKLFLLKIQIGEDFSWRVRHGDPEFEAKKFRIYMDGVTVWAWISKTTITENQLEQAQRERKHSCSE